MGAQLANNTKLLIIIKKKLTHSVSVPSGSVVNSPQTERPARNSGESPREEHGKSTHTQQQTSQYDGRWNTIQLLVVAGLVSVGIPLYKDTRTLSSQQTQRGTNRDIDTNTITKIGNVCSVPSEKLFS